MLHSKSRIIPVAADLPVGSWGGIISVGGIKIYDIVVPLSKVHH